MPKKPLFGLYLERRSGARLWLFACGKVHGFKHPPAVSPAHAFDADPPGIEGHGQGNHSAPVSVMVSPGSDAHCVAGNPVSEQQETF